MVRIAVTGSTGLIGSAIARYFERADEVVRIGRRPGHDIIVDLSVPQSIETIDLHGCDVLIHCAGVVDEDFVADPEEAFRRATRGASALAATAARSGIKDVCYVSTAHVYGPLIGCIDEKTALNPLTDYAISHFATEQIFRRNLASFNSVTVLRPCAVFGMPLSLDQFRRWSLVPFSFPKSVVCQREIRLRSSGIQRRNFVAAEDIARSLSAWLRRPDLHGWNALNPIGQTTLSVWEFAQLCAVIAREQLDLVVQLSRQEPAPCFPAEAEFNYNTVTGLAAGEADLGDFVRNILIELNACSTKTLNDATHGKGPECQM